MILGGLPTFKGLVQGTLGKFTRLETAGLLLNGVTPPAGDVVVVSGTTHSPVAADNGKTFIYTSGSPVTVTMPTAASAGNWAINVVRQGAGRVDFTRSGSDNIVSQGTNLTTMSLPSVGDGGRLVADSANTRFFWVGFRSFESTEITLATSVIDTQAHSLGVIPKNAQIFARNKTTELGYAVNDELPVGYGYDATSTQRQHTLTLDATNGVVLLGSLGALSELHVLNKTTPAAFVSISTAGNWKFFWRAWVLN